jgi:predicted ester cyclase
MSVGLGRLAGLTARIDGRTAQSAQAFASAVESAVPTVRAPSEVLPYASGLFSAFPDLRFELHVTAVDEPYVVAQWTMIGTQSGPLNGLPPTEARIKLPGIDVITLGESGLLSVEGYFDHWTLLEQLGVQVTVQPTNVGPFGVWHIRPVPLLQYQRPGRAQYDVDRRPLRGGSRGCEAAEPCNRC